MPIKLITYPKLYIIMPISIEIRHVIRKIYLRNIVIFRQKDKFWMQFLE